MNNVKNTIDSILNGDKVSINEGRNFPDDMFIFMNYTGDLQLGTKVSAMSEIETTCIAYHVRRVEKGQWAIVVGDGIGRKRYKSPQEILAYVKDHIEKLSGGFDRAESKDPYED